MLCTIVIYFQTALLAIFNNVSPLPCSHPACSKFCIHLEFLPEIVCKVGKVCKVENPNSTFNTFHDYLNFCGEKKNDRLFTFYFCPISRYYHHQFSNLCSSFIFLEKKIEPPYSLYLSSCRAVFINTFCPITRTLTRQKRAPLGALKKELPILGVLLKYSDKITLCSMAFLLQ